MLKQTQLLKQCKAIKLIPYCHLSVTHHRDGSFQSRLFSRRLFLLPEKEGHRERPLHSHRQPQPTSQSPLLRNSTSNHRPDCQQNNKPNLAVALRVGTKWTLKQPVVEQQVAHQRRERDGWDLGVAQPLGGEYLTRSLEGQEGNGDVLHPDGRVLVGDAADGVFLVHDGRAHEEECLEEKGEDQVDAAAGAENAGSLDEAYSANEEGGNGNEGFDPETFGVIGFAAYGEGGPDDIS